MSELNFALLNWQQEVFKDTARFKVVAAGRRCGKSRLSAVTLLIEALNCPEGSAVMYIAPTLGQARTIIWDLLHELGRPVIKSSHINNLEILLVNGRKILVRGADNPDSLRGVSLTYVVMDECAFIKEDVWQKIIRASLSDKKGRALFISTPSGRNWFYDVFKLGQDGSDEEWKAWHKDALAFQDIDRAVKYQFTLINDLYLITHHLDFGQDMCGNNYAMFAANFTDQGTDVTDLNRV